MASSPKKSSSSGRPPTVKFARRTSSGRIQSLARDEDLDNDIGGQNDYTHYTVMMPPTPDNQPMGGGGAGKGLKPDESHLKQRLGANRGAGGGGDDGGGGGGGGKSLQLRNQAPDFDHNRWLFETKGTYGYGNAYWPQEGDEYGDETGMMGMSMEDFMDKPWKPLTRKIKMPPEILSPYRSTTRNP